MRDKFAARLASSLASHGPALLSTMLSPSYPLGRTAKNPALLATLASSSGYRRVPQSPLVSVGACASGLIALCELAPHMLLEYPGHRPARLALWTAADAATRPDWRVVEAFGPNALVTGGKLDALNEGRTEADRRSISASLAPFDIDACGTVIGDGGSGLVVTTLDFALRNFCDVTSIIVGWGQSGETGGKAHFAGVGFGGENAIIQSLGMAAGRPRMRPGRLRLPRRTCDRHPHELTNGSCRGGIRASRGGRKRGRLEPVGDHGRRCAKGTR